MRAEQTRSQGTSSIVSRLHEADICRSKGLLSTALELYERVLEDFPRLSPQLHSSVQRKIAETSEEMQASGQVDADHVGSEGENPADAPRPLAELLSRANALVDLGLFDEAEHEYEAVFRTAVPDNAAIVRYVGCLFNSRRPGAVKTRALELIDRQPISNEKKALLADSVGHEMESRGQQRLATLIYYLAEEMRSEGDGEGSSKSLVKPGGLAPSRYELLLQQGKVTDRQIREAAQKAVERGCSVDQVLLDDYEIDKALLGESLSQFFHCPFKRFEPGFPIPFELIGDLKRKFLLNDHWVPLTWDKLGIEILVDDPGDIRKTDHIRALMKTKRITLNVGTVEDIEAFIDLFFKKQEAEEHHEEERVDLDDIVPQIDFEEYEEAEEELDAIDESANQIVRLVDQLLVTAFREGVSDIHVEPSVVNSRTTVRFRRDGVCHEYLQIPNTMVKAIVSRLKILAGLDIAERRLPQDGKIKFRRKGIPPFELRLATIPTAGGFEDAVLRVLAMAGAMKLEEMGLKERNLALLAKASSQPYGLILVVGPTGSGKTTTLHAALHYINTPGIKIWTAEDPIEITQDGLRQVEVSPKIGLDFSRVMRAFLRADPDVIMIGEMRDLETASIAIEASLTGHLVFSTLHTNSAPETVTRLLDMGLNPLNFSDALLAVLAQRLVRRVCKDCRTSYHPNEEEFDDIVQQYGQKEFEQNGFSYSPDLQLYRTNGCDACAGSGYRGRMGIHEVLNGSAEIRKLIKRARPTEEVFAQAFEEGMTTLKQDAIEKVLQGHTDMNEVRRVCIG